jgi:hypothetical protein
VDIPTIFVYLSSHFSSYFHHALFTSYSSCSSSNLILFGPFGIGAGAHRSKKLSAMFHLIPLG